MLAAERRARQKGEVGRPDAHTGESASEAAEREPKPNKLQRALNAVIPVLVLVLGSLIGIYDTHVRTQIPYAVLVGIVAIGLGSLPVAYGFYPSWVGLLASLAVLVIVMFVIGRSPDKVIATSDERERPGAAGLQPER